MSVVVELHHCVIYWFIGSRRSGDLLLFLDWKGIAMKYNLLFFSFFEDSMRRWREDSKVQRFV